MLGVRAIIACLGVFAALTLPPWVALVAIIALAARWRAWEAPFIGLLIDFMWLPAGASWHAIPVYTLLSLGIMWVLEPLRARFL